MPLSFRQRIFVVLAALTAVPTILAVIGWALAVRAGAPSTGARVSLEQVAVSAREMLEHVDTLRLDRDDRAAMGRHLAEISNAVTLSRRAETYLRYYTGGFVAVVLLLGLVVLFAGVRVAGHLSRQLSRPIDELVGWTRLIRRRLPLPAGPPSRGAPEFQALRQALRELVAAIEAAREHELESERQRAFREVARRVAHEIKNPLTSMRIAVDQLGRAGGQADGRTRWRLKFCPPRPNGSIASRASSRTSAGCRRERRATSISWSCSRIWGAPRCRTACASSCGRTAGADRSPATTIRCVAPSRTCCGTHRRRWSGRGRDRHRHHRRRGRRGERIGRDDRGPWRRDSGGAAPAGVRAVLHHQARRDRASAWRSSARRSRPIARRSASTRRRAAARPSRSCSPHEPPDPAGGRRSQHPPHAGRAAAVRRVSRRRKRRMEPRRSPRWRRRVPTRCCST